MICFVIGKKSMLSCMKLTGNQALKKFNMWYWDIKISSQGDGTFFCSRGGMGSFCNDQCMQCGIADDQTDSWLAQAL